MTTPRLEGINEQFERAKLFLLEAKECTEPVDRLRRMVASIYFASAIAQLMDDAAKRQEVRLSPDELNQRLEEMLPHFLLIHKIRIHDFHRFGVLYRQGVFVGGPIKLKASQGGASIRVGPEGLHTAATGRSEVSLQRPLIMRRGQVFDEEKKTYLSLEKILSEYLAAVPTVIEKIWGQRAARKTGGPPGEILSTPGKPNDSQPPGGMNVSTQTATSTPRTATASTVFEPVPMWAKVPHGITFGGDATSVAVDSQDRVYVFNRGNKPIVVFDRDGNFVKAMGEGEFDRPHGIAIDSDDNLYLADDAGHFVQKRTPDGEVVFTLGERGKPAAWQSGGMFNRPTGIAISKTTGDLFVSDGYGNSRVHRFDRDGKHILSWGEPGTHPGQFSLPHNICMWDDDRVVICDRENFRLQVFTVDGEFVDQWHIHHPMSIAAGRGTDETFYVGEMGPPAVQVGVPGLGNRVSVVDRSGNIVTHFGDDVPGQGPGQFIAPHGIAADSRGDVYVAEVSWTYWFSKQENPPRGEVVSLRKWRRVSG